MFRGDRRAPQVRTEHLQDSLAAAFSRFGATRGRPDLTAASAAAVLRARAGDRVNAAPRAAAAYRDFYDDATRRLVEVGDRALLSGFGYQFDQG